MSQNDEVKAALADLSSLSRVEHKLAMTEAAMLERVLNLLLPRLLARIGTNHSNQSKTSNPQLQDVYKNVHTKLVSMLGHIMKRVRDDSKCQLPCLGILKLLLNDQNKYDALTNPFTLNLALAFLTLGLPRTKQPLAPLLPGLLVALAAHSSIDSITSASKKLQASQVAHLVLRVLEGIEEGQEQVTEEIRNIIRDNEDVAQSLYDLLLDCLLYQPMASPSMPPPGLSQTASERLRCGSSITSRDWATEMVPQHRLSCFKIALLNLIAPTRHWTLFMGKEGGVLGTSRTVALLIVGSGDAHKNVAERASLYLKAYLEREKATPEDESGPCPTLGHAIGVLVAVASLMLGQVNAEGAMSKLLVLPTVPGLGRPLAQAATEPHNQQLLMSLKRRMTSEKTSAAIMTFCTKILDDTPHILLDVRDAQAVATLSVYAAQKILASYSSGLSVIRAEPFVAAARLLNSLCTRLVESPTVISDTFILETLTKALDITRRVLAHGSTHQASSHGEEGSVIVRDACYGVICTLSRCVEFCEKGSIFGTNGSSSSIETATLLFGCASNEHETLRARSVAALDAMLSAYKRVYETENGRIETVPVSTSSENPWNNPVPQPKGAEQSPFQHALARALLPLLWGAGQSSKPKSSRTAATRWGKELLYKLDRPNSCHLLCYFAGDSDVTVRAIAREGLGLSKKVGDSHEKVIQIGTTLPAFGEVTKAIFTDTDKAGSSWRPRYIDFTQLGKAAALRFGLNCLLSDLYGGDDKSLELYLVALCDTLQLFGTANGGTSVAHGREHVDLLDECSAALSGAIVASPFARIFVVKKLQKVEDLKFLAVSAPSSKARRFFATTVGQLLEDYELWGDESGPSFQHWMTVCDIHNSLGTCANKLAAINVGSFNVGEVHGSAFLAASIIRAFRLLEGKNTDSLSSEELDGSWKHASTILSCLGRGTSHIDEVVGDAFAHSVEIALAYDSSDAPPLIESLHLGVATALKGIEVSLAKFLNGDHADPIRALRLIRAAGTALAASTSAAGKTDVGQARLDCVDALFKAIGSPAYRKDNEVALVTGEALAMYADAYPVSAVWSTPADRWPDEFDLQFFHDLPPHQQVLCGLLSRDIKASSPHQKTAVAPALAAIVARAARSTNINTGQPSDRALVVELSNRLVEIQQAFLTLLSDPKSKQLSRESCCIGLAACRTLSIRPTAEVNNLSVSLDEKLLRAFGQTTRFDGSAMMESRDQNTARRQSENRVEENENSTNDLSEPFGMETSEAGGTAGLGEAALGAFREMASAAVAIGRSDILYGLLVLSVSHQAWFSEEGKDRYSALSLLGEASSLEGSNASSAMEIRTVMRPHIGKLIPRLLRAKHDPNKQTRDQIEVLWIGLTGGGAESRRAITEHLLPTIDSLIIDATSKLWRARVGACGALSEVIAGRSWDDLGGGPALRDESDVLLKTETFATTAAVRLVRLWRVSMRALDDIRGAVRDSGESLGRSVRAMTIRLCDPTLAIKPEQLLLVTAKERERAEKATQDAASTSLPWLLKHGLTQQCAEAVGVCISCLIGIVEVVQPTTLEPVLPDLVYSLLMSMSSLEPGAFNYLQVRAAGSSSSSSFDDLERMRINLAQQGPIAMALNKSLDMVPLVEYESQKAIIPQLDSALRGGIGFATRSATADSISTLCTTCPGAFKFQGSSSTNPTVRLLRALYYASEREHGAIAKDRMSHALGNLAALSPGRSVRSLALRACERYCVSCGNNDDPVTRRAAAAAVRAIAVRASAQLADGGPNDVWNKRVLPVAFLGQKDDDEKVAVLWKQVWEEGSSSLSVNDSTNFGTLIEERLLPGLVKASIRALGDVSWSRRVAGATSIAKLSDLNVLVPLRRGDASTRTSKHEIERANRRAFAAQSALAACVQLVSKSRVWAGKTDVVNTTVKLAAKWTTVSRTQYMSELGETDAGLTWLPFFLHENAPAADLFVGDGYFEKLRACSPEINSEDRSDNAEILEPAAAKHFNGDEEPEEDNGDEDDESPAQKETETEAGVVSFLGLCRCLLEIGLPPEKKNSIVASQDEVLPLRASSLQGVAELMNLLRSNSDPNAGLQQRNFYQINGDNLLKVLDSTNVILTSSDDTEQPPVVTARSVDCLTSLFWNGIGLHDSDRQSVLSLGKILAAAGGPKQGAWTVREAAAKGMAVLVEVTDAQSLRNHEFVALLLESASFALQDLKFRRVRVAGLCILRSLASRAGSGSSVVSATSSQQMTLEALLPFKEDFTKLCKRSLSDSQAEVTSLATEVMNLTKWWP